MKKLLAVIIAVMLVFTCLPVLSLAAEADITRRVDGNVKIVVGANCSETDKYAAETLQRYIKQITGKEPVIVSDTQAPSDFELAVGSTNRIAFDFNGKIDGSSAIKSYDGGVSIAGAGTRGTIYGVYNFLEQYCNCHWYTAEYVIVPKSEGIDLPENINDSFQTYFEYTDTDWKSPHDVEFSLANGLSGGIYRDLTQEQGGTVDYLGQMCHTLSTVYCAADTYFAEHPEYFAFHDGKRVPDQLCLANEEVYNIVLAEVMKLLEEQHNPAEALQIVSLTQHDNANYCQCEACKAIDDANGGAQSGSMITFVNKVAREVAAKGYSNVAIDTFAYWYTRKAPTAVVPEPNVIIRLCTVECCFSHALNDATCEENKALMADLADWNKICNRIYIWDYTNNFAQTIGLFPDFGVLQENMQVFAENCVKGIYECGNYYMASCDTEFGELRSYLLAKLLENPYCDYRTELENFCNVYYGNGGKSIIEFLDIITADSAEQHLSIFISMRETLSLSSAQIAECDALWTEAKASCNEGDADYANIVRSEISWRYWKACNGVSEYSGLISSIKEKKQLNADIIAAGVTKYNEGHDYDINPFYQFLNPAKWQGKVSKTVQAMFFIGYTVSVILIALSVILSLVIFILAFKRKKWLNLVQFPLTVGMIEVALWSRRAFLSWKDLDEYAITMVITAAVFALFMIACKKAKQPGKLGAKKAVISAISGILMFIIPYELSVVVLNNIIYNGSANDQSLAVAYMLTAVSLFTLLLGTVRALKKDKS